VIHIDIRPVWRMRSDTEREFDFRLVSLLGHLEAGGKLTHAAEAAGMSYRHAWNLIEQWEAFFGAPLVDKAQGKGTTLTVLGQRLLWAARRAQARLAPELENLASEFARSLNGSLSNDRPALAVQASHDFALALLRERAGGSAAALDLRFTGSFDALSALRRGECDIAGFHVPLGPMGTLMQRRYREGLPERDFRMLVLADRTQGLIVRAGNPLAIRDVSDLCRADVRMVNRQRGSGTRALLEFFISSAGLDRELMRGYEHEETTHGAVAALIAGHQADVGFGVRAAAAQYRLDFIPVCDERYYLAFRERDLHTVPMRALLEILRDAAFRESVAALPGYAPPEEVRILEAFEPASADS
jgi:molybdate transport repressor ModE-like protein